MYYDKIIIILSLVLLYIILNLVIKIKKGSVPNVSFPFKNIFDENGNKLNVILISAPFRQKEDEELYEEYKNKGLYFCGISSYSEFPDKLVNPFEDRYHEDRKHDYTKMVSTWLYCFREIPEVLKKSNLPMILLTEADLKDTDVYKPDESIIKTRDFIYSCPQDNETCSTGWQSTIRNWELAKRCLGVMCEDFNLSGLLIGRTNCEYTEKCKNNIKTEPFLPFHEFQKELQKSKFLFVPNGSDASPRVITEALSYNIPVLVNKNIVGGWHNVIPGVTGEFFTDENDVKEALEKITKNYKEYTPRKWFIENRGKKITGKILAEFLKRHYPKLNNKNVKCATISI